MTDVRGCHLKPTNDRGNTTGMEHRSISRQPQRSTHIVGAEMMASSRIALEVLQHEAEQVEPCDSPVNDHKSIRTDQHTHRQQTTSRGSQD